MLLYKPGTAIYLEIDSSMWRFCLENALILPLSHSPILPLSEPPQIPPIATVLYLFPPQVGLNFQRLHYN